MWWVGMYLRKKRLQGAFDRQQNFVNDTRESQPQVASLKLIYQRQPQVPQKAAVALTAARTYSRTAQYLHT